MIALDLQSLPSITKDKRLTDDSPIDQALDDFDTIDVDVIIDPSIDEGYAVVPGPANAK